MEEDKPAFDIPTWASYHLSEHDLALHPQMNDKASQGTLEKILWECGMDVRGYSYKAVTAPHRTLQGVYYHGLLYCGRERRDKEWQNSGCATVAGMIDNEWDYELKRDLNRLNR